MFESTVLRHLRTSSRTWLRTAILYAAVCAACVVCGMSMVFTTRPVYAQDTSLDDVPQVTQTVAIRNAKIVRAPGDVLERGTIVMRDGLITTVGIDAAVPYDAEIIEGDSLTVYAGFIDGLSHVSIPIPESQRSSEPANTADPAPERAGIQPHQSARNLIDPTHESIRDLRNVGFTVAHVVPRGRMLPGGGSIVLLSGESRSDMVIRPDVSVYMRFAGASGVYPATPMAVMAKLRQLFREADRSRRMEAFYDEDPAGIERPSFDPIHQAFYPVLNGEKPLFIYTGGEDGAMEVHRAIQLRDELGFSLALAGLNQGFYAIPALEQADVPLFVTLALPSRSDTADGDPDVDPDPEGDPDVDPDPESEPGPDPDPEVEPDPDVDPDPDPDTDPDSVPADTVRAVTPEAPATFFASDLRTHSFEDVEREAENLTARQLLSRREYVGTAAMLRDAGLQFGFTTMNAEPEDIRKNIREMIDAGLSEDAALAALTVDAARLLNIDRVVGTVEPGKIANLVVTVGSYFGDDKSAVRHVFVDGRRYDVEIEDEKDAEDDEEVEDVEEAEDVEDIEEVEDLEDVEEVEDVDDAEIGAIAGTWNLRIRTQDGELEAVLMLTVRGRTIAGHVSSPDLAQPAHLLDPEYADDRLAFDLETPEYGLITAQFEMTGSTLTGTIDVPGTDVLDVTGTKVP